MMKTSFLVAWQYLSGLAFIFIITFVIYPGVITATNLHFLADVEPMLQSSWNNLILVFVFNVSDTISRYLGGQAWATMSGKAVLILSFLRCVFIATSLLIAWDCSPAWLFGVDADWFKIVNMFLFAFSNGYCSTQLAIKAPSVAPDDSKENVGTFVGVFITLGITLGSIIAIFMGDAIPKSS